MYTSRMKIRTLSDCEPTEFEESVAQALFDLENTNQDLTSDLKDLYIDSATQIDVSANCKAAVIRYPYKLSRGFRKIQLKLVGELEKKFSGNDVGFLVFPIARKEGHPMRVLHEAILRDIVHPAEIVAKCVVYDDDGVFKFYRVYLDWETSKDIRNNVGAFAIVFKELCGHDVEFVYATPDA